MYVEAREQELYQYSARQLNLAERTNKEDSGNEEMERGQQDFYLKAGEELDFS